MSRNYTYQNRNTMYHLNNSCRACGYATIGAGGIKSAASEDRLIPVFDLGVQPLANDFANVSEERSGYAPLKVMFCPKCTLAQLSVVVRPEILYSRYLYVTSQSQTMRDHFDRLHDTILSEQEFSSLLEIGSNDGTLLRYFASKGCKVAGIDPAENLVEISRKSGIPTIAGVFNAKNAQCSMANCRDGFDIILARHVFCHIDDWREFVDCLSIPSHKNTLVCIEVPYVKDLLSRGEFDTIYHEHLSYLSIKAMDALLKSSPFRLQRIVQFDIHGGALLLMLRRRDCPVLEHSSVKDFMDSENITLDTWKAFENKARDNIVALKEFVKCAKQDGKRVVGFGASAKSTVWVNACVFTRKDIEFITDTTLQKLYKLSPGTDIPIVDEGAILRELPDYAICFAWNFRDYVLKNNELARSKGVKFVFPIPTLEVV